MRYWNLVLVELDAIQSALERFARVEAGQHSTDLVGAHFFGGFRAFRGRLQPEAAEIAQLYEALAGRVTAWRVENYRLVDIPERKNNRVEGKYVLEVAKGATIAVKVTDMLGEEALVLTGVAVSKSW